MKLLRLLLFASLCALCGPLTAADKPNLIFILSDDLAQGDLGCYGQKLIQTPRLDRMAREGKPIQALRFGNWKAVKNGPQAAVELYDLAADAAEKNNRAKDKPDLVANAVALMNAAHADDPNWPLTGRAPRRLVDEKGAFPAASTNAPAAK